MKKAVAVAAVLFCGEAAWSAADGTSCIVGGSLVRDAAASAVSGSALVEFDAVGLSEAASPELTAFDSVGFCSDSSAGGNLNSRSPALMIVIH